MKKYIYSIFAAATLMGFAACDEGDYADWANPQQNAQEEILSPVAQGVIDAIGAVADTYDFASYAGDLVKIFNPATSSYPTTYQVAFPNGTVLDANDGNISAESLKSAVVDMFGKRPEVREVAATVIAYIEATPGAVVKATKDVMVKAKLVAPEIFPHLYIIGAPSQWDPTCTTLPFTHSGKDVYDDPVFTVLFPVEDGDTWFAMADDKTVETNDWSNVFAAVEGNGQNLVGEWGKIARRCELPALNPDAGDGSFMIHVDGDAKFVKVTVNLLEGTYLIEKVNFMPYIYFIGATDGWTASSQRLAHEADGVYKGFCYVADPNGWGLAFKFQREAGSWDNEINAGVLANHEGVHGDNNFEVDAAGVYYMEADLANGSLKCILVEKMGLIGGFNGWGDDDLMTWDADNFCFIKEGATVSDAGWKFRINADWGINLGGKPGELNYNGDNLDVAGSTVKLYPCRVNSDNIYCTVE